MANVWKPILIISSLLLALTYLWLKSTPPDLDRRNRLQETLRVIELREAELMRDILLARAGLLPNYDALTLAGHELLRLANSLKTDSRPVVSGTGQNLAKSADALATVLQDKLAKAEYFKSDNALLRNSVMYFNLVGKALNPRGKSDTPAQTGPLWQAMFSFMATPDPESAQAIQGELNRLAKLKPLPKDYRILLAHGGLIVKVLPKLDELLRDIIDTPITAAVDDFQIALNSHGSAAEDRAKTHRLWLYLVAVVLVGYVIYQFLRLRKYTLDLRRAHSHLQQEIVERQHAEVALRDSEEQLCAITESAHEAIVSVNSYKTIVSWNRGATAMFGYTRDNALGMPLVQLLPGFTFTDGNSPLNPNRTALEWVGRRQDGSEFPLELSISSWVRGEDVYVTAIIRDISTRKQLEETARQQELKLIQANKMTALGTLVAGVAHEINNPNQLILMNSSLLEDSWGDAQEILDDHVQDAGDFSLGGLPYSEMRTALPVLIHDIKDGAKRIERIVADLKHFSRPQVACTQVQFSLNEAVECAVRLLNHLITRKSGHFTMQLADGLPLLSGDPQQIEQVVVNLLVNALEALPDPSCAVAITTFPLPESQKVCLEVRDEGCGIAAEHLTQLCDPFFTTKQGSGGTGLGLAITASLVRAHAGRLSFSSAAGKGTRARVVFPVSTPRL
ncbi:DAHL domain-containing protein [Crenothrix polyspora]|uniref:histidine kinase n=1 Tax=Crenothrix polyspora TaxID=360316 RepID=A0A1R4HJI3_9GAMM|nr:DAHL domain-containing protein [Crenothrix polyspora]SJM96379.1 putative Histidine kinase [Crenothrix polyspora]